MSDIAGPLAVVLLDVADDEAWYAIPSELIVEDDGVLLKLDQEVPFLIHEGWLDQVQDVEDAQVIESLDGTDRMLLIEVAGVNDEDDLFQMLAEGLNQPPEFEETPEDEDRS